MLAAKCYIIILIFVLVKKYTTGIRWVQVGSGNTEPTQQCQLLHPKDSWNSNEILQKSCVSIFYIRKKFIFSEHITSGQGLIFVKYI